MAFLDSLIGYSSGTVSTAIPTTFSDSSIGFGSSTLADPAPVGVTPKGDSVIGFAVGTLSGPASATPYGSSQIGYASGFLTSPHKPIVIRTSSGYKRTSIKIFNGTVWK